MNTIKYPSVVDRYYTKYFYRSEYWLHIFWNLL